DEPFSNLDAKVRERMRFELLARLKEAGVTTILVTHDQLDAAYMSDRVVVLDTGEITQIAPYSQLYNTPSSPFVGDFIGESNWFEDCTVESVDLAAGTAVVNLPGAGSWVTRIGGKHPSKLQAGGTCSLMVRRD